MTQNLSDIVLSVRDVSKHYGNFTALNNVSFDLHKGEIIGIVGPSGGGKTTLLRCLDFLTYLDKGIITYKDVIDVRVNTEKQIEIRSNNNSELLSESALIEIRKKIGFVFQTFNLWENQTVLRNIMLAPKIVNDISTDVLLEKATNLCRQYGLESKLNSKIYELSGGQKQRVAIIRALMMDPQFMFLDEITSALDPVLTNDVLNSIKQLKKDGLSMMLVTHHIDFAASLCDRIMYIENGEIIQLDEPSVLRNDPATSSIQNFLEILNSVH